MAESPRLFRVLRILSIPIVAIALALMVDLILHPFEADFGYQPFWSRWLYGFIFSVVNIIIGALCTRRAPGNVIGPLLMIYGAGLSAQSLRVSFEPVLGATVFFIGGTFGWVGFFILLMLFPNGKPYPRWMGKFLIGLLLAVAIYGVLFALGTPQLIYGADDAPTRLVDNPFYLPDIEAILKAYLSGMFTLSLAIIMLPVSLFLRYRASSTRERAQIRWILWGALVMGLSLVIQRIADAVDFHEFANIIGNSSTIVVFTLPAFAVGNAILRYKLYDIDIIIRRTLVYSILTAILAAIYFGGVVLTQQVLKPLTESSDLAIVISTLAIAALFTPLRRRIQSTIDRRFFRRKYDAQKTLARFNQTLRDEVDIETLKTELVGVVQETMQPTKVALWVKE